MIAPEGPSQNRRDVAGHTLRCEIPRDKIGTIVPDEAAHQKWRIGMDIPWLSGRGRARAKNTVRRRHRLERE